MTFNFSKFGGGKRAAFKRSGLEVIVERDLKALGIEAKYEAVKLPYSITTHYKPDFLLPNGIYIETKGWFPSEDRRKMRLVKEQHPTLDIRMVFNNPQAKIAKGSDTTYAMWCDKHRIPWAKYPIPLSWIKEHSK